MSGAQRLVSPDDPAFQALKARVIARTGHHYYADKDGPLIERLAARIAATRSGSLDRYLALLDAPGGAEWRRLESAVTINETFFFRFAEQFDLLRRTLLPRLIEANRDTHRLRIWSVGCSIGAEPYSIAVLLHDLLGPELPDWRIALAGTDIDEAALAAAREARYSAWALRTLGPHERARLFDREGEAYRLKQRYRGLVRFEPYNMMRLLDPAAALQFTDYDLILCRNVLIYFSHDVAKRMVAALAERLTPGGTLLLGHAEAYPDFADVTKPVELDGILTYRRRDAAIDPPPEAAPEPAPAPPKRVRKPAARARAVPPAPPEPAPSAPPALDALRATLARGDAEAALDLAEQAAAQGGQDPVPHYLAALGALALGRDGDAERGFRKALYLDNRFVMAHYMLGRHLLAQGRGDEGHRALGNAARAAAALDPAADLPEGDGMTAGGLVAAVRSARG